MELSYNILKSFIQEGDCVLVGVSGGADSMCLIDLIDKYSKICSFKFYAVHINHNLRNEEALRDEDFVRTFCKEKGINFIKESIKTLDYAKENLKTIEQAGRELRYKVFEELSKTLKANKLFVAHHKDDQAETVLMHILRGSSIKGASGIKEKSNNIFRPLLKFTRKEIEKYNKDNNIKFVTDSSNNEVKYTRNYIRNVVLPTLSKMYPNVVNSLSNFAEECEKVDCFIEKNIDKKSVNIKNGKAFISVDGLNKDSVLSSRLIKYAIECLGVFADIEKKHIDDILKLKEKNNGKSINLTNNLVAYKEYDFIVIETPNRTNNKTQKFFIGNVNFGDFGEFKVEKVKFNKEIKFEKGCLYLDYDKIPEGAEFRTRKDGDIFKKFGSGTKKLSDYFTDSKISRRIRDNVPLLAYENNVLCVVGKEISDSVKVSNDTKFIIKIY